MQAAANASAEKWYYLSPYESEPDDDYYFYDYEDLTGMTISSFEAMLLSRLAVWAPVALRAWRPAALMLRRTHSSA